MSSWGESISNAAKQTAKDQLWPVFTVGSAIGGAKDGYNKGVDTYNNNKANAHKAAVGAGATQAKQSVAKVVVSTAVKATGVGAAISIGTNFAYRLGQEQGAW